MNVGRDDRARSWIVLVGTPTYADPNLPDVPAVANNVADLEAVLTDPDLGGFDVAHCLRAPPEAGVAKVGDLLLQAAAAAEDLLLFYYSGHGLLGPRRRELYLTLADTRPSRLAFTALPFDAVRDAFLDSRATSRVVILDSCYSGRAIGETLADDAVMEQLEVVGTYTLTAAPANRTALFLPGEEHTAFTERLLQLLRAGTPAAGPMLRMGDIYRHLLIRLRSEGLPEPQQRGTATADLIALVRNPGCISPTGTTTASGAVVAPQPAILPASLRSGLNSGSPQVRAAAIQDLAGWLTDPDPARALAARTALVEIARGTAAWSETDSIARAAPSASQIAKSRRRFIATLGIAERVAGSISDGYHQALALTAIARAMAAVDSDQAARIGAEAERVAADIVDKSAKVTVLTEIVKAVAAIDPELAARVGAEAERTDVISATM